MCVTSQVMRQSVLIYDGVAISKLMLYAHAFTNLQEF